MNSVGALLERAGMGVGSRAGLGLALALGAIVPITHAQEIKPAKPPIGPGGVARPIEPAEKPADQPDAAPATKHGGGDSPDLSDSVRALLSAPYLKPDELKELRITHGVAKADELDSPARRARMALLRSVFDDPSLTNETTAPLDRAAGALARGDLQQAIDLLGKDGSARAIYLRTLALDGLGRADEARAAAVKAYDALVSGKVTSAADIVSAVRTVFVLTRLRATEAPEGEFQALMRFLAKAREADPLEPGIPVAEAELLLDKDNFEQAQQAINEAIALCPANAEAWQMLASMAVNSFDLPAAERLAKKIDLLANVALPTEDAPPQLSPLAAAVRARAMLRQNDPESAFDFLAPALKRYPNRRELLEYRCAIQAVRYDVPGTEGLLADYDKLSPGSPRALLATGRAMAEARQYAKAAEWLGRARDRAPHWAQPVIELGLLEMQSGRDQQALDALERAAALDPFNVRVDNSLKLIKEVMDYSRVSSDHFVVRSRPGLDALLAAEMLPALERMHAIVCGDGPGLRYEPKDKTLIDLMPDHHWFAVRIAGMPRIHTIAASTGPIIAMESPRDGRGNSGTYDWERVVRHEYTHTVGLSRTGNRIPHWFTEAQAVFMELSPRDERTVELLAKVIEDDELFDFEKINIAFTRPEKPTDRAQAYAQGHWMYQYIVESYGPEAPLKLMDLYAKGVREEEAFKTVLEVGREDLLSAFKLWASGQLRQWGMLPPEGMPTMKELIAAARKAEKEAAGGGADGEQAAPEAKPADDKPAGEKPAPVRKAEAAPSGQPNDEQISAWLEKYPTHPDVLELAVRSAVARYNGAPDDAMRPLLARLMAARPVDPLPHRLLARLELASADPTRAIEHLEYLDAREEKSPTYAVQLATLYARAGQWEKAGQKAERATRVAPFVAANRELAATIAVKRNDLPTARRHIEFLIALEPDRPIHKQRLEALTKMGTPPP